MVTSFLLRIMWPGLFFSTLLIGKEKAKEFLDFSKLKHFQVSLDPALGGIRPINEKIRTFPKVGNYFIESQYHASAKEADLGFGSLTNPTAHAERIPLADGEKDRRLKASGQVGSNRFFLDSSRRQLLHWDEESKRWHTPIDIILDLLRPAADRKGEPTQSEIRRIRSRFTKVYSQAQSDPDFLVTMIDMPGSWRDQDGSQFVLLLKMAEFSLVTMRCTGELNRSCRLERACNMPSLTDREVASLAGMTYSQASRELWIGLNDPPRMMLVNAPNCLHLSRKQELPLPSQLRKLSGLFLDIDRRLWITTAEPDLAHSASVFVWDMP